MECPFCKEEIKEGASKCKHCGSELSPTISNQNAPNVYPEKRSSTWMAIASIILGVICILALFEEAEMDKDAALGGVLFSLTGLVFGIISVATKRGGRGMAIAGIILGGIAFLGLLGEMQG